MQLIRSQTSLLGKLSVGGGREVFLFMAEETARQGQGALAGLDATLYQQDLKTGFPQREDDEVNRKENGRCDPMIVGHESTICLLSL